MEFLRIPMTMCVELTPPMENGDIWLGVQNCEIYSTQIVTVPIILCEMST